jgi:hypothetical protein
MANFSYTLLKLVQKVSFAVGNFKIKIETLANPGVEEQHMIECVNEVIRKIWQAKATPWNLGEGQLQVKKALNSTVATPYPYTSVTLALTNGSTTGTLTFAASGIGADFANWVNRAVWPVGTLVGSGFMRVVAAVSGGADTITLTFAGAWPYATVTLAAAAWNAPLDRYELAADFGDFITAQAIPEDAVGSGSTTPSRSLKLVDVNEMDRLRYTMRSTPNTVGNPNCMTIAGKSTNSLWLAELDPFPDDNGMIRYRYKKVPAPLATDAEKIPLPDESYDLLANGCIALWQQRTGVQGREQAFEMWKKTDLAEYVSLDRKITDGRSGIVPADTMRSSGSVII